MNFEEQFPSLYEDLAYEQPENALAIDATVDQIQKFCLDKQRVREAIDRWIEVTRVSRLDYENAHFKDLKKELGL
jgi:hypothetical protein